MPPVDLLRPDLGLHDLLRLLFRRRSEREDHLAQARPTAPKFMINSDASIVAPLIFAYVLGESSMRFSPRLVNADAGPPDP